MNRNLEQTSAIAIADLEGTALYIELTDAECQSVCGGASASASTEVSSSVDSRSTNLTAPVQANLDRIDVL